jgi:hypothetical protein
MPGGSGPIFSFGTGGGSGGGGGGSTNTIVVTRPQGAGLAVGDPVYLDGTGTAQLADATAYATGAKLAGVVSALNTPAPGQCQIQCLGDLDGFAGLTPGEIYLLALGGGIVAETDTANPAYPDNAGNIVVEVGLAATATKLFVNTLRDPIEI